MLFDLPGEFSRQLHGLQAEVYDASPSRISNSRSFNPHSTCHSTTSCFELHPAQLCSRAYLLPVLKACRPTTSARLQDILGLVSGNGCSLAPTLWQSQQLMHPCMITLLGDTNDCAAFKGSPDLGVLPDTDSIRCGQFPRITGFRTQRWYAL